MPAITLLGYTLGGSPMSVVKLTDSQVMPAITLLGYNLGGSPMSVVKLRDS